MYLKETQSVITWEEGGGRISVTCYSRTNISGARTDSPPDWSDCAWPPLRHIYSRLVSRFQSRPDWMLPVAVVPGGAVRFPGSQTDPAEVCLASLVLADHVVAATVLLYGGVTLQRTIQ